MAHSQSADIRLVAAAIAERGEAVTDQDRRLMQVVAEFRQRLRSPGMELRTTLKLADELAALATPRLELAGREADTIGKLLAMVAPSPTKWVSLLRTEIVRLESLVSTLRVTVEILEARAEVAEKLSGTASR